ncbi:hypothetical protein KEM48_008898 [Puccinia striiformis f. sp. tritici PST-130]|nr:hypothetical protein KEM48_008898 [Puccinia striiformis f. sp. tritici PST-130]
MSEHVFLNVTFHHCRHIFLGGRQVIRHGKLSNNYASRDRDSRVQVSNGQTLVQASINKKWRAIGNEEN